MFRLLTTLVFTLPFLTSLDLTGAANAGAPFSEIVVFGDSLSDTGNGFLFTGGVAAGPPYFQGRFSNGPVWVEVLAQELGLPAPGPSLAGGSNYAFGGAETGDGLSFFGTPNVGMQIDAFLPDRGGFAGDELIVLLAGGNDLAWRPPYSPAQVVRNLVNDVSRLAAAGGRTFLVSNMHYFGNSDLKREVNLLLPRRLDRLQEDLGITIFQFDLGTVFRDVLLFPEDYGLTNVTDPACPGCGIGIPDPNAADTLVPNPDEYLFWDLIHWTRVVHAIVGKAAADLVSQQP